MFRLDHAYLVVYSTTNYPELTGHAIAAFRCRGKDYIYDSREDRARACKWSDGDPTDLRRLYYGTYIGGTRLQLTHYHIFYACYVNSHAATLRPSSRKK